MSKKLISSVVWAMTGQVGYMIVAFISTIILARLLTPEDFGIVGIAMFFVAISNVLVESGMGGAIIRKQDEQPEDYSTIFIFNLTVSLFLILVLILSSHAISAFYARPELRKVIVALSSLLLINAFTITQNVKLMKRMQFKERGIYKIISLILASSIAIYLAWIGYSYWAIIWMQILSSLIFMFILWVKIGTIKKFTFSKKSFLEMSSFGLFTTLTSLLNTVFDNIYQLIIGKYFSIAQVGYYYQAKKLQEAPDAVFKVVILQVFYAHLSKLQNQLQKFKITYNFLAKIAAIVTCVTACFIYIYAEEIISIVLGPKWVPSVFFLKILIIAGFFNLQEHVNRNLFKIFNQTHKIFYLELFKKSIQLISIVIGVVYLDMKIMLIGFVCTAVISYFINFAYSRKIIDEVSKSELLDFIKVLFIGVISTLITLFLIQFTDVINYYRFLFIPVFLLLYSVFVFVLRVLKWHDVQKVLKMIKR